LHAEARRASAIPGIAARQQQAELAFRMQAAVPELVDLGAESAATKALYGPEVGTRGTFANNALLARRLLERGVRCVQIYHRGWDQHKDLERDLPKQCGDIDQPTAALLTDLRQRGLLDDTLVVWTSEFGRTVYAQGDPGDASYGRDHHPRCFVTWLAGRVCAPATSTARPTSSATTSCAIAVHVHDLNATLLHLLGFDHERLTFRHEGRDYRLTDVHGRVVRALLA
jgi:uncharacterized protein (DUF1501 family)